MLQLDKKYFHVFPIKIIYQTINIRFCSGYGMIFITKYYVKSAKISILKVCKTDSDVIFLNELGDKDHRE